MSIRNTLPATQAATYSISLPHPDPKARGFPIPTGTGFFVSGDGWFVTAAHVVVDNDAVREVDLEKCEANIQAREADVEKAFLEKEARSDAPPLSLQHLKLEHVNLDADFALLKADLPANKSVLESKGHDEFPHLQISRRTVDEGEPVYAFGYPLSSLDFLHSDEKITIGAPEICPRATSAIVSSTVERTGAMSHVVNRPPENYVLDRALNYGNSGGPIVAAETGYVHAVCSRFQPVRIPQPHLEGEPLVLVPSLYGMASNLGQRLVLEALEKRGISLDER
jgi:S1-C subfamily serine protease